MRMLRWALGRLLLGLVAVALTLVALFLAAEGMSDPVAAVLGPDAPDAQRAALRERLGLDRPLPERAILAATHLASGDFGRSYRLDRPARDVVGDALPATLALAGAALPVGLIGGVGLGLGLAALGRRGHARWVGLVPLAVQAVPSFVAAIVAVQLLAVQWRLFPASGREAFVLPSVLLGAGVASRLGLLLADRLSELAREPFVLAALARGAGEWALVRRHLLRPAGSLVVSYASLQLGYVLGGSLVLETVFAYPGVGRLAVAALASRDLPVLMAAAAASAVGFLLLRFGADLALLWLDPRVRDGVLA